MAKKRPKASMIMPHQRSGCRWENTFGWTDGLISEWIAEAVTMAPMIARSRPTKNQMDFMPPLYQK